MKKFLLSTFTVFITATMYSQIPADCGQCMDCRNDCGPFNKRGERKEIISTLLNVAPYDGIIHIGVKRAGQSTRYSTATFIDKDVMITANHNVMTSLMITSIQFNIRKNGKDVWITLGIGDFEILHFTRRHDKWNDVALIWIKNLKPFGDYKYTIFNTADIGQITTNVDDLFHLTGFPCDKPDILMDKTTQKANLEFDATNTIISYSNLFTCTGDSGAPLWIEKEGKFYIVGIHHGGDDINAFPEKNETNISRKLTPNILNWIKRMLQ